MLYICGVIIKKVKAMEAKPYKIAEESPAMSVAEPVAAYGSARQRVYYKPDADFYRSVTAEELLVDIHKGIDRMFDEFERKKCG